MILKEKLQACGYVLPTVAAPAANYVPYVITGNLIHIAGQIPFLNGKKMHIGRLGDNMSLDDGIKAAEACALNILAQANDAVDGNWSQIKRCIKLGGFVNSTADFYDQPKVINGASDLVGKIMGDEGKHTRFAVGAPSLPLGVAVEIDAIFEMKV